MFIVHIPLLRSFNFTTGATANKLTTVQWYVQENRQVLNLDHQMLEKQIQT